MSIGIGSVISGYCEGAFGRDHYEDWRIEAMGPDWVVVRKLGDVAYGEVDFCSFSGANDMLDNLKRWTIE